MKFGFRKNYLCLIGALFAAGFAYAQVGADAGKLDQADVLTYLDQLVEWQRSAMAIEPAINNARERIYHDTMQQNATKVLTSGFEFSRAEATLMQAAQSDATDDDDNPATASPQQMVTQRAKQVDQQIAALNTQRGTLRAKPGAPLAKQRQDIDDQLRLLEARKELLQAVLASMNVAGDNTPKGFLNKIGDLERSIPELNPDLQKTAAKPATGTTPSTTADSSSDADTSSSSSIIGLASNAFDIVRKQRELKSFKAETLQLDTASQGLMKSLRASLESSTNAENKPLTIDQRVAIYKQVGAAIIPLGKTRLWIIASERTIKNWCQVLDIQLNSSLRKLGIRLAVLAIAISIPLIISKVTHRAITRYIADVKRQNQLNTARRIVTGLVILFILLATFISDFSSFATFAGFITAGLALALQSVLLSLVAHFFFYGRFGVRAGDRVNVAGVTGEIVQIGMVRFYMRELREGAQGSFEPTGKVVAFPNSILFQNSAFYKYV